ncbi:MAG: proline iminopeptidase-family hydrolase [Saprospiraceae bacterium]|nr:proline iminopeptidase-family hydrolase [Candidatus Vicinibacter affinis]
MRNFIFLITVLSIASCTQPCVQEKCLPLSYFQPQDTGILNGGIRMIPITTPKGNFKVWTKRIGNNPKIKLLLLHGGPGTGHEYFECMESFLPQEGIEFIYYDQLGTCNSDKPTDTSLWDLSRSVDELEQVRKALHLDSSNLYLLGHSWGGILAMEYALKYQQHLKGLIISDMMSDAKAYGKYADEVLSKKLPATVLDTIRAIEHRKDFSNPQYMELLMPHFYEKFICRIPLDQWPEPVNRSFAKLNQQQYVIMQGPSEFGIAGKLENWDRSNDLKQIKVRTLIIGATYDTMDPAHMEWMSKQISGALFHLCPNGSHMCMWDDQQSYFKGLIGFLKT